MDLKNCKRCHYEISSERMAQNPIVCDHCGQIKGTANERLDNEFQKRISNMFILGSFLFVALFAHLVHWQNDFFRIIPLKIKIQMGTHDRDVYIKTAEICMERRKFSCVINSYNAAIGMNANDLDILTRLAKAQDLLGQTEGALITLERYFLAGGNDASAAHRYAKLLEKVGKLDVAEKYYLLALAAKPEIVQVTVTQDYVRMLMKQARYKDAQAIITERRKSGASEGFLGKELSEINLLLNKSS
jgi:tetratricopeptide (TPR) repeat protein